MVRRHYRKYKYQPRACIVCQSTFIPKIDTQKYCSKECCQKNSAYYRNRKEIKKRCIACGNEYITYMAKQLYCSNECHKQALKQKYIIRRQAYTHPYLRMRFEVFERDKFKCRYCGHGIDDGRKLVVDHILAKARSGQNELANFVTACVECNAGKSDILLLANKNGQLPTFIKLKQ